MRFRWPDQAGTVVLVVSVKSVHYGYILLSDEKTNNHCNSRAFFLKVKTFLKVNTKKSRFMGSNNNQQTLECAAAANHDEVYGGVAEFGEVVVLCVEQHVYAGADGEALLEVGGAPVDQTAELQHVCVQGNLVQVQLFEVHLACKNSI